MFRYWYFRIFRAGAVTISSGTGLGLGPVAFLVELLLLARTDLFIERPVYYGGVSTCFSLTIPPPTGDMSRRDSTDSNDACLLQNDLWHLEAILFADCCSSSDGGASFYRFPDTFFWLGLRIDILFLFAWTLSHLPVIIHASSAKISPQWMVRWRRPCTESLRKGLGLQLLFS